MTTTVAPLPVGAGQELMRFAVSEYDRLIATGVLDERRCELIRGYIVEVSPQNDPHSFALVLVDRKLRRLLGDDFTYRVQCPMRLRDSMPEPDVVVLAGDARDFPSHPPTAPLVVEIAGSSVGFDREVKATLYDEANVDEYWIVNIVDRQVEVYRRPSEGGPFNRPTIFGEAQSIQTPLKPGHAIAVRDLLP